MCQRWSQDIYANDVRLARDVTSLDDENFVFHYAH